MVTREEGRGAATCDLLLRVEMLEGMVSRLQAERNRRVELTELGKLSEELEEDNWGSAATLVRSAMHELEDLRSKAMPNESGGT